MTGRLPTIPYPDTWDQVMDGTFTLDQIKALIQFYDQPLQLDKDGKESLWQLQSQLLQYIGCTLAP